MYLLTAVADLVRRQSLNDNGRHQTALERLWTNMVEKKMYLTGGIGAIKRWEGFGIDYFLPSGTDEGGCYSETCAAIGVMMLAERLLQVSQNTFVRTGLGLLIFTRMISMANMPISWSFASTMRY